MRRLQQIPATAAHILCLPRKILRFPWLSLLMLAPIGTPLQASIMVTEPASPLVAVPPPEPAIELDIDGDGVVDFVIPGSTRQINVYPQAANRVLAFDQMGTFYAADLADGSFIGAPPGADMVWRADRAVMSACFSGGGVFCFGRFLGGIEYLGIEFDISGNTHYGWIEIESRDYAQVAIVHRWAYESAAGVPLRAGQIPEPTALAFLLACLALAARRRRRMPA